MESIPCPVCDSWESAPVATLRERLLGLDGAFSLVRCSGCGLHFLNPQPTALELARYYPDDYGPYTTPPPHTLPRLQRLSLEYGLRRRCRAVTRLRPGGRLLEVGCANGLFLDAMRRLDGWQVVGVEINEAAARQARDRLGLEVLHGTLEAAAFPAGSFDAVVLWDVLEHLHNPRQALAEIRRVLVPQGVLLLRVPVHDSWERRLFGTCWAGWDAPRHLATYSLANLERLLMGAGFGPVRSSCSGGGYPTFALSIQLWARGRLGAGSQARLRHILGTLPVRLLAAPGFFVLGRLGQCTVRTVVARPAPGPADLPVGGRNP